MVVPSMTPISTTRIYRTVIFCMQGKLQCKYTWKKYSGSLCKSLKWRMDLNQHFCLRVNSDALMCTSGDNGLYRCRG